MRDYAKSSPRFWEQGSGRRLRGDYLAQLVAQYLISAPGSNMIGLYYLNLPALAHHVGSPLEGASEALRRACREGFCAFDQASDLVWIFNVAQIEFGDALKMGDNRIANIVKLLRQFGQHPFVKAFLHRYGQAFKLKVDGVDPSPLEGPWEPLASPSEGASYQKQDQKQKQKQVIQNRDEAKNKTAAPATPSRFPEVIACWFEHYEKKYGTKPKWGPKHGRQLSSLLSTYTVDDLLRLIPYFFAWKNPDVIRGGHSWGTGYACFVCKLDELQADISAPERRKEAAIATQQTRDADRQATQQDQAARVVAQILGAAANEQQASNLTTTERARGLDHPGNASVRDVLAPTLGFSDADVG